MKTLKDLAAFIKEKHLGEMARTELSALLSKDISLMKPFKHLDYDELLRVTEQGLYDFLSSILEGTQRKKVKESLMRWGKQNTQESLQPADLILIYSVQKHSLLNFIPSFTQETAEAMSIIREIEDYYTEVEVLALDSLMKAHAQEIESRENSYRILAENSTDIITRTTAEGVILYASPSSQTTLGFRPQELIGKNIFDFLHPEDITDLVGFIENPGQKKPASTLTFRILRKNGSYIWIESSMRAILDKKGKVVEVLSSAREITERKNAEEKLKRSEALLNETQHLAKIGSWEWAPSSNELTWSEEHYRLYGFTPGTSMTYEKASEAAHPQEKGLAIEHLKVALEQKKPVEFYHKILKGGAEERVLQVRAEPVLDPGGKVVKLRGTSQDVTEIKKAEEELQNLYNQVESRLYFLAESMPHKVWTMDNRGNHTYLNALWEEYSAVPLKKLLHNGWALLIHPAEREGVLNALKFSLKTGEDFYVETRLRRADGEHHWHSIRAKAMRDKAGEIIMWVGTSIEIHEQKAAAEMLEEKVRERTQQLHKVNAELEKSNAELLQFASVASHDLKEPLRKIQTFGTLLKTKYESSLEETGRFYLERVIDATSRMQVLINDLLSFSRLSSPLQHFEKTDLNRVLEEILTDLEITIKEKNARFIISALPQVEVVPGQIRQVFQNIISNSLKFCSKDAVPVIKVYSETRQNTVQIYIEDNGIGFDEKYLDRIFTIFQRLHSREDFEGTGIGLAICKKVMENHSGEITARSRVNEGSCFILTLPLTQEKNKE